MSKYLKKLLFSLLILMMPYMNSASKAMDEENNYDSSVRVRKVSTLLEEERQDVLSFAQPSTTSNVVNLEDSKVSWMSYLSSPVKRISQNIEKIINFAVEHPRSATVMGLFHLINAANAMCHCYCSRPNDPHHSFGCSVTPAACMDQCNAYGYNYLTCNANDGCF